MMKRISVLVLTTALLAPAFPAAAQSFRAAPVQPAYAGASAAAASVVGAQAPAALSVLSIGAPSLPLSAVEPGQISLAPAPSAAAAAAPAPAALAAMASIPAASAPAAAPSSAHARSIAAAPAAAELARPIAAVANAAVLAHFASAPSARDASLDEGKLQALYGESRFAAAADGPAVDAGEGGSAARAPLAAAAPAKTPAAQARAAAIAGIFDGTWHRVSGNGQDRVNVTASGDQVSVRGDRYGVHDFYGINGPTTNDAPWRGNFAAPGGLVTRSVTTVFNGGKLVETSMRIEKPTLAWPTALLETTSLSVVDGRLVLQTESKLLRRTFFYFGPFNVETKLNTTNLADPARPLSAVVYERDGSAPAAAAQGTQAAASDGPSPKARSLMGAAVVAALTASATPLLAATPAAAAASAHPVLKAGGGAAIGAIAGFAASAGVYKYRHRNDSHGDYDFSGLAVLFFGLIGAAVGGIAGAVIGAAL